MSSPYPDDAEWLEADGLGGFASGTVSGVRTRRYHALLLPATTPPTGRVVLVNGFDAWVAIGERHEALSAQRYVPAVVHPDGARRIVDFHPEPWPHWTYRLDDGTVIEQEIVVRHGAPVVLVAWRLVSRGPALEPGPLPALTLSVRPFLSGRDYHALHHENPSCDFTAKVDGERVRWRPYAGVPAIVAASNGRYVHEPDWYRNFVYTEEQARGLDCVEDLAAPGVFHFDLGSAEGRAALRGRGRGDRGRRAPSGRDAGRGAPGRRAAPSRRVREPPRAQRRRLSGHARRGPHDRRRLPVVHRLGTRHLHRASRSLPRDRTLRRRARHPARVGRRGLRRACCRTGFPITATCPSSTPSTPRSGS